MKSIDFKKGGVTFLEFAVCGYFLLLLLLLVISIFIKTYTVQDIELLSDQLARDVVVCTSKDEADKLVKNRVRDFTDLTYVKDFSIDIDYLPGGGIEWKKGNYIQITFFGHLKKDIVWKKAVYSTTITKMIENAEDEF